MIKEKVIQILIFALSKLGVKMVEQPSMLKGVNSLEDVRNRAMVLFDEAVRNRLPFYSRSYEKTEVFQKLFSEYPWIGTDIISSVVEGVISERSINLN